MNVSNFFTILLKWTAYGVIFFFLTASCAEKDDAAAIRQLVEEGAKLAEKQDINGLMKLTTEDFLALPGKHDNREVKTLIWLAFKHYRKFRILFPEPSINVAADSQTAFANVKFLIVKKDQSLPDLNELWKNPKRWLEMVGENADLYQLKLEWLKKDKDWLVRQARLESFRGLGFGE
jgi:ketosteroid isomerase-like protein